jgi:hypothetical protein
VSSIKRADPVERQRRLTAALHANCEEKRSFLTSQTVIVNRYSDISFTPTFIFTFTCSRYANSSLQFLVIYRRFYPS